MSYSIFQQERKQLAEEAEEYYSESIAYYNMAISRNSADSASYTELALIYKDKKRRTKLADCYLEAGVLGAAERTLAEINLIDPNAAELLRIKLQVKRNARPGN